MENNTLGIPIAHSGPFSIDTPGLASQRRHMTATLPEHQYTAWLQTTNHTRTCLHQMGHHPAARALDAEMGRVVELREALRTQPTIDDLQNDPHAEVPQND